MQFEDFKPKELLNKLVLFEYGKAYNNSYNKAIRVIDKVLDTGFRISGEPNRLFGFNGWQKGLGGKMDIGTYSKCYLITAQQAYDYRQEWAKNKKAKDARLLIKDNLESLSYEKLMEIQNIITNQ